MKAKVLYSTNTPAPKVPAIHMSFMPPTRNTMVILLAEGDRRLRSCSPDLPWETKAWFLTDLSIQMMDCGHSQSFRDVIISRVVARYTDSLARHLNKERPLYRTKKEREDFKVSSGGKTDKSDWFRKAGATPVITVPSTVDSKLASKVKEALKSSPDPTGCSTLVREQPGPSVTRSLVKNDPDPKSNCGRSLCPFKLTGRQCKMRCYREGVVYAGRCRRCFKEQTEVEGKEEQEVVNEVYIGESSRSVVSRAREHYRSYQLAMRKAARSTSTTIPSSSSSTTTAQEGREEEDEGSSLMADHAIHRHGGTSSKDPTQDYEFFILWSWQKPMYRQIEESVRIKTAKTKGILILGARALGVTP